MRSGRLLALFGLALLLSGCKSSSSTAAGSGGSASGSAIPSTTQTVTINDPSLNSIPAMNLTIPSGWKIDGAMLGSACNPIPWPVFRAYSPDGLTEMRNQPVFGWTWSASKIANPAMKACLPLTGPMTAAQFLQYYVGTIPGGVHVVGTMPVSAQYQQGAQNYANSMNANNARLAGPLQANNTADTAALRIRTVNGSFVIDQRLRATLECAIRSNAGPFQGGSCFVRLDTLRAPQDKLDALVNLVDGNNLPNQTPNQQWLSALMQRQQQQGAQMLASLARQEQQESHMLLQQHQQIMATMQANHNAFMAQQESQFQSAMAKANASMNAQSTATSDWVDYALDQQTVAGPGGVAKVSSAYSQTWSSTSGGQTQWYQTMDPSTNPNGTLPGNWTQDTKVHGNGQPY